MKKYFKTEVFSYEDLPKNIQEQIINRAATSDWHIDTMSDQATEAANAVLGDKWGTQLKCTAWNDKHGIITDFEFEDSGERIDPEHTKFQEMVDLAGAAIYDVLYTEIDYVLEDFFGDDTLFDAAGNYVGDSVRDQDKILIMDTRGRLHPYKLYV